MHIDGSRHQWFQDERWYDLIVILADATSEIYYAQLVEEESTATVMTGLREVIERKGVFCALYSDRGSHFWLTPKVGSKVDCHRRTQVGRALHELGVQMIPPHGSEFGEGCYHGKKPYADNHQQDFVASLHNRVPPHHQKIGPLGMNLFTR